MKTRSLSPNLVEQVHDAILDEIASGHLAPGERIVQEQIAAALGVSRQPVQQALLLLRSQGLLHDAPGRGLIVARLDPGHVQHMYDVRGVIEGLAARRAADTNAARAAQAGPALIDAGRKAVASGSLPKMIAADMRFHEFIYELAGNPLIAPSMATHWTYTQRVMGEVLMRDDKPRDIWDQHAEILKAIAAGNGERAEALARKHITEAADFMIARLREESADDTRAIPAPHASRRALPANSAATTRRGSAAPAPRVRR
jgi:DNA-binding GntR family transcriptional regulator